MSRTNQDHAQHCPWIARATSHRTLWKVLTVNVFVGPLPLSMDFRISRYVKSWSFKVLFKSCWAQRWTSTYFFMPLVFFFNGSTLGSVIKQRGSETSGLLFALSGAQHSELPACDYLNWIFHFIHSPLKKEIIACLEIYFLSYCNLEDSDKVNRISKTQEKVLSIEKSFASVPVFSSE